MEKTRVLLASDVHWCHLEWYGMPNRERLDKFAREIEAESANDPFAALLFLGDYSLDHWQWGVMGSYLREGISNTGDFVSTYMDRLKATGAEIRMIAGNHEQYGEAKWQEVTGGFSRRDSLIVGDYLFILLDNYAANLDPRVHSDGCYVGVDVDEVRAVMNAHPNKRVILCAHHFSPDVESAEFKRLVREDDRIVCMIGGHVHKSRVVTLNDQYGGKCLLYTGHYSYSSEKDDPLRCPWGFRELILSDGGVSSRYITPESTYVLKDRTVTVPYGAIDTFEWKA